MASTRFPVEKNPLQGVQGGLIFIPISFHREKRVVLKTNPPKKSQRRQVRISWYMIHNLDRFSSKVFPTKLFQIQINFPPFISKLSLRKNEKILNFKSNFIGGIPKGWKKKTQKKTRPTRNYRLSGFWEGHMLWSFGGRFVLKRGVFEDMIGGKDVLLWSCFH